MTPAGTSRVRWFLVFWLFVLSGVSYLDRVNISIAGGSIAEAYHLSDVQLGKVFSAMLVGYALFQTVGGRLADRFGPRRVLAAGVMWWGIFTGLTAMVPANISGALFIFIAVRFLLGAGESVIYPSANQFIARWIPCNGTWHRKWMDLRRRGSRRRTYAVTHNPHYASLRLAVIVLGMRHHRIRGRRGVVLEARDTPEEHNSVSASELALIRSGLTQSQLERSEIARTLEPRPAKQRSLGPHCQLFLLRLRGMDLL